jgi:hypothetical protein
MAHSLQSSIASEPEKPSVTAASCPGSSPASLLCGCSVCVCACERELSFGGNTNGRAQRLRQELHM